MPRTLSSAGLHLLCGSCAVSSFLPFLRVQSLERDCPACVCLCMYCSLSVSVFRAPCGHLGGFCTISVYSCVCSVPYVAISVISVASVPSLRRHWFCASRSFLPRLPICVLRRVLCTKFLARGTPLHDLLVRAPELQTVDRRFGPRWCH